MNANEVIANLAGESVHRNDHVNMGQSSNDVFPSAVHLAALGEVTADLLPAMEGLAGALEEKASAFADIVKAGRTHLMDAVPVTLGQEFGGYAAQIRLGIDRVTDTLERVGQIPLGGTATGTGLNTHPDFAAGVREKLVADSGLGITGPLDAFEAQANRDSLVELSGALKVVAVSLIKIANDLALMGSGPRVGLAELRLPELQKGSSIMPGKVNPVIPEVTIQVGDQVIGNDAAISIAGSQGQFELNVRVPLIARNLLDSIKLQTGEPLRSAIWRAKTSRSRQRSSTPSSRVGRSCLGSTGAYRSGLGMGADDSRRGRWVASLSSSPQHPQARRTENTSGSGTEAADDLPDERRGQALGPRDRQGRRQLPGLGHPSRSRRPLARPDQGRGRATNAELGLLDADSPSASPRPATRSRGAHDAQFPIDVFQTGSGTSTNMNANEVIATLAATASIRTTTSTWASPPTTCSPRRFILRRWRCRAPNCCRHWSARGRLAAGERFADVVKTGRTHLMDAVPVTLGQVFGGYATQVRLGVDVSRSSPARRSDPPWWNGRWHRPQHPSRIRGPRPGPARSRSGLRHLGAGATRSRPRSPAATASSRCPAPSRSLPSPSPRSQRISSWMGSGCAADWG